MRVLWLIKGLGPGGAEHLLVSTARAADRCAFTFSTAYLLDWKTALVETLEAEAVEVSCLGVRRATDPRWLWRLRKLLVAGDFDVVHVHSPVVGVATRFVARTVRRRPKLLSTEHNSWASHTRWTRGANRFTFRLDDANIAVSEPVRSSLPEHLRDRVEVIVHGIDLTSVDAARAERNTVRAELGLEPQQVVLCTVANLRWQKGYPDLLQAAKTVIDAGHDVVFLAVGQGPLEAEITARRDELGLGDRFRLLGYRPDALRIMAASDIFTLASLHEGFPIAVMEALAAGLPVVATDAGGIPEAVRNGVEGQVLPAERPELLARALIELVADPELRRRMSAAARERGKIYDIAPAIRRTEEIYRRLAGRSADVNEGRRS